MSNTDETIVENATQGVVMRLFYLLLAISIGWSSSSVAETLTLWNGHRLEPLQPEMDRFATQSGHQDVQQLFRADQFRDKVMSSVLLPVL